MTSGAHDGSARDRFALYDLFAAYGALIDAAEFDAWLALFAATCTYHIVPRELSLIHISEPTRPY